MTETGANKMQIGIVGLGHMGGNISWRLMRAGHQCVVFDRDAGARATPAREGLVDARSVAVHDAGEGRWTVEAAINGFGGHIEGQEATDPEAPPSPTPAPADVAAA